jgi:hypothetical protein
MGFWDKFRQKKQIVQILIGVSKIALGGRGGKVFEKIDKGTEFVDKGLEIAELLKSLKKN